MLGYDHVTPTHPRSRRATRSGHPRRPGRRRVRRLDRRHDAPPRRGARRHPAGALLGFHRPPGADRRSGAARLQRARRGAGGGGHLTRGADARLPRLLPRAPPGLRGDVLDVLRAALRRRGHPRTAAAGVRGRPRRVPRRRRNPGGGRLGSTARSGDPAGRRPPARRPDPGAARPRPPHAHLRGSPVGQPFPPTPGANTPLPPARPPPDTPPPSRSTSCSWTRARTPTQQLSDRATPPWRSDPRGSRSSPAPRPAGGAGGPGPGGIPPGLGQVARLARSSGPALGVVAPATGHGAGAPV